MRHPKVQLCPENHHHEGDEAEDGHDIVRGFPTAPAEEGEDDRLEPYH